jgi:ABC-2 type transport system permease protein
MASSTFLGSTIVPLIMKKRGSTGGMMPTDSLATAAGVENMSSFSVPGMPIGVMIAIILFFLLGYLFYSCLYAAVGSTVNSDSEAQQAATPVAMLLVVSAVFIQPVALSPQSALSVVMSMIPFSAPLIMPMRMSLMTVPVWQIIGSLVATALSCLLAVWFSARIYRIGLLMYGKRPSIREILKWLKY